MIQKPIDQEFEAWLATRPLTVQEFARARPPGVIYRMLTDPPEFARYKRYTIYSYHEVEDQVTGTSAVTATVTLWCPADFVRRQERYSDIAEAGGVKIPPTGDEWITVYRVFGISRDDLIPTDEVLEGVKP